MRVEADATRIAAALRVTRAAAMNLNREMRLVIDAKRRTFASPVIPLARLDPESEIGVVFANTERGSAAEGGIRFFPNGQSTGGDIRLRIRSAEARVRVNWATGYAGLGE
jgi:general secretion pathway protein H